MAQVPNITKMTKFTTKELHEGIERQNLLVTTTKHILAFSFDRTSQSHGVKP